MELNIANEFEGFIQSKIDSGKFQTPAEVVQEALRVYEQAEAEREADLAELRASFDQGILEAERGEVFDGEEVFKELFLRLDPSGAAYEAL